MDPEDITDPKALIYAEEVEQKEQSQDGLREQVVILEETDVTKSSGFSPTGDGADNRIDSMPVSGSGKLDLLAVRSSSSNFSVYASIDDSDIIDGKSYQELNTLSADLSHVSAYSASSEYVVTVTDYPFHETVRAEVIPHEQMTFSLVRAELFMDNVETGDDDLLAL